MVLILNETLMHIIKVLLTILLHCIMDVDPQFLNWMSRHGNTGRDDIQGDTK